MLRAQLSSYCNIVKLIVKCVDNAQLGGVELSCYLHGDYMYGNVGIIFVLEIPKLVYYNCSHKLYIII